MLSGVASADTEEEMAAYRRGGPLPTPVAYHNPISGMMARVRPCLLFAYSYYAIDELLPDGRWKLRDTRLTKSGAIKSAKTLIRLI